MHSTCGLRSSKILIFHAIHMWYMVAASAILLILLCQVVPRASFLIHFNELDKVDILHVMASHLSPNWVSEWTGKKSVVRFLPSLRKICNFYSIPCISLSLVSNLDWTPNQRMKACFGVMCVPKSGCLNYLGTLRPKKFISCLGAEYVHYSPLSYPVNSSLNAPFRSYDAVPDFHTF